MTDNRLTLAKHWEPPSSCTERGLCCVKFSGCCERNNALFKGVWLAFPTFGQSSAWPIRSVDDVKRLKRQLLRRLDCFGRMFRQSTQARHPVHYMHRISVIGNFKSDGYKIVHDKIWTKRRKGSLHLDCAAKLGKDYFELTCVLVDASLDKAVFCYSRGGYWIYFVRPN